MTIFLSSQLDFSRKNVPISFMHRQFSGGYAYGGRHWYCEGGDSMRDLVLRFANDQSGATAIEYGLIAAGIAVAIIAVVNGLGVNLNATFGSV
jgi:pilus assembly protein Flp/PilA